MLVTLSISFQTDKTAMTAAEATQLVNLLNQFVTLYSNDQAALAKAQADYAALQTQIADLKDPTLTAAVEKAIGDATAAQPPGAAPAAAPAAAPSPAPATPIPPPPAPTPTPPPAAAETAATPFTEPQPQAPVTEDTVTPPIAGA